MTKERITDESFDRIASGIRMWGKPKFLVHPETRRNLIEDLGISPEIFDKHFMISELIEVNDD